MLQQNLLSGFFEEPSALMQSRAEHYLLVKKSRMGSKVDVLGVIFCLECLFAVAVGHKP